MNKHRYQNLTIEVLDEPTYDDGSADNIFNYGKQYFGVGAREYPTSRHGIRVYFEEESISSCLIIGSGGATGISENSSAIGNGSILVCCCDTVYCLDLPNLELEWQTQADQETCFAIYILQDDYLVHGEMEITRLDNNGNIKWQLGGADIFVSLVNEEAFVLRETHIELIDFCQTKYLIDFDGNQIY